MIKQYKEPAKRETVGRVANEVAEVVKRRDISDEVIDLRDALTQAHEIFTILEEKTQVIRYPVPQCQEKDLDQIQSGSELRSALSDQNQRLRALMRRMSIMIDEIDL